LTSELYPPPLQTEAPPVLLRRSSTDRVLGGVASGLGRYLGIDPVILRIAFVLLALSGGSGVLLYLIAWIAISEEREGDVVGLAPNSGLTSRSIAGSVVIAVGCVMLVSQFAPGFSQYMWPVGLIALGAFVMLGGRR
jgi:phage shock protein C